MSRMQASSLLAIVLLVILLAHRTDAQVLYGSVVGTVVDETGRSVAGAKVRITSTAPNRCVRPETDESGTFSFPSLTGDTYDIVIAQTGFQRFSARGITVAADSRIRVDATLRVGQVEQSIEVSAAAAALQTDSGEVRTQINTKTIENLPIPIGRNYQNLLITVPGVSPPANQHSVAANPSRGLTFNVNGSTRNSNNVRIDGALCQQYLAAARDRLRSFAGLHAGGERRDRERRRIPRYGRRVRCKRADQERNQ